MDTASELRVALLRNWMGQGFDLPVYGVVDADELAKEGMATLAIAGRRWCMVTSEDVWIVAGVPVGDVVTEEGADGGSLSVFLPLNL